MTEAQRDRYHLLSDVLEYTSIKTALLNVWEKMLIHQERAYLLNQSNPEELRTIREYRVPNEIEQKIKSIVKLINE